jgi:hypothetical protein
MPTSPIRYFTSDDTGGQTASALRKLIVEKQIKYIFFYFNTHFRIASKGDLEFCANEYRYHPAASPLWTSSNGFLDRAFGRIVRLTAIKRADELLRLELANSGSPAWITNSSYYDLDSPHNIPLQITSRPTLSESESALERGLKRLSNGAKPRYGSRREEQLRHSLNAGIQKAQKTAKRMPQPKLRVPINQQSEYDEEGQPEMVDTVRTLGEIDKELKKGRPDAAKIAKSALTLANTLKYINKKIDVAVTAAAKSFGKGVGRAAEAYITWQLLHEPLHELVSNAASWISTILQH